eukprot:COSAG05_NODE_5806_length_1084_cov_0.834518_1_plen_131_part_00
MQEADQEAQTAQHIISILAMVSWLDAPVDAHSLRARQIPAHTLVCTTLLTRLVHGVLQCVIGYLVGKTRVSMQAQYGYQARGIPPSGVAQPVPFGRQQLPHALHTVLPPMRAMRGRASRQGELLNSLLPL